MIDLIFLENLGDIMSLYPITSSGITTSLTSSISSLSPISSISPILSISLISSISNNDQLLSVLAFAFLSTLLISAPVLVIWTIIYRRYGYIAEVMKNGKGSSGLIIIGETMSWKRHASSFFKDRFERYGEVFYTKLQHPAYPTTITMEPKKPIKNLINKFLASFGVVPAKTCLCIRIKNVYSFQLFQILQSVLETNGIERKIHESIQTLLRRLSLNENYSFTVEKVPAVVTLLLTTIILDISVLDIKLLEALQSYNYAVNIDERYANENIIRSIIKVSITKAKSTMKKFKENLIIIADDVDTVFPNTCSFLEIFLEKYVNLEVEDIVTIMMQFFVESTYVPLVEQMKTLVELVSHSTSTSPSFVECVNLYKDMIKKKNEPCQATEKVALTKINLSWVGECSCPLQSEDIHKKTRRCSENDEEQKNMKEGQSSSLSSSKTSTKQTIETVSQYKIAIRRLVEESRRMVHFSKRPVYYRAVNNNHDIDMNGSNSIPKGVINLKFPADIMIDECYELTERNLLFEVIMCSLAHQMISEIEWIGGNQFMDDINSRNSSITHSKEAFRY